MNRTQGIRSMAVFAMSLMLAGCQAQPSIHGNGTTRAFTDNISDGSAPPDIGANASPTTHNITVRDIESYYAKKNLRILDMTPYVNYHAVLVESNNGVSSANDYDWWNLQTGEDFYVAGRPVYMTLKQVMSEDEIVFLATGGNSESPGIGFPYYIDAKRSNPHDQFTTTNKVAFFPVGRAITFGDGKVEEISAVNASSAGVTIHFAPIKGENAGAFAAGSYGGPWMRTSYTPDNHVLTIRFEGATIGVDAAELRTIHTMFLKSVSLRSGGSNAELTLQLTDAAKFYTGKLDHTANPSVTYIFSTHE